MATVKSFTDLPQSKRLTKFLPIESADMFYNKEPEDESYPKDIVDTKYPIVLREGHIRFLEEYGIPCWSLAALLNLLPNEIITDNRFECHYQIDIRKYDGGDNTTFYQIAYGNNRGSSGSWHDMINTGEKENLVDCCVQMIINLKEKNLI